MSNYELISENEALKKRVKELEGSLVKSLESISKISNDYLAYVDSFESRKARVLRDAAEEIHIRNPSLGVAFAEALNQYANKLESQND